jgi:peptidoglycan hydrolase CwlO-like protein
MRLIRTIAVMFFVMGVAVASARAAVEIKDLPPSNWAYKSVKMLVEKGYLAIYDDGSFRGDQPVSRVVFATALGKLIDQIANGELALGGGDMDTVKKLGEEFRNEIADYDSRMKALEKRVSDIESAQVVIQTDISKATVEFRDKTDKLAAENKQMRQDINILTKDLDDTNAKLRKETSDRKKAQSTLWIGIVIALAAGLAGN